MGKFELAFSGCFQVETDMSPEVYRAKIVHILEKALNSDIRLDGSVEVDDLALTVSTRINYDPNTRYWEAYIGGHGEPLKVAAKTEWEAREYLRKSLQRRRLPNGTVLTEVTGSLIQGSLL